MDLFRQEEGRWSIPVGKSTLDDVPEEGAYLLAQTAATQDPFL